MSDVIHFSRRDALRTGAAAAAAGLMGARSLPALTAPGGKRVTVVTGSPHRRGTSFLLADEFILGVREQGAEVFRFDSAFRRVTACSGCDRCGLGTSPCVYRDDMFELNPHLLESNLVVF